MLCRTDSVGNAVSQPTLAISAQRCLLANRSALAPTYLPAPTEPIPLKYVVQEAVKRWFEDTLLEAQRGDVKQQALVGEMYKVRDRDRRGRGNSRTGEWRWGWGRRQGLGPY